MRLNLALVFVLQYISFDQGWRKVLKSGEARSVVKVVMCSRGGSASEA